MVYLLILFILSFSFCGLPEARPEKKLPSAVVVGTVFCDTCFQKKFSNTSFFISGAVVAVECRRGGSDSSKPNFREEAKTDKKGEFRVQLPDSVRKHAKEIDECSVKLIRSGEPHCAAAAAATSSSLQLKSRNQGTHTFSAGYFTFKPYKRPNLCNHTHGTDKSNEMKAVAFDFPAFPTPIQNPNLPNVPRIYDNFPQLPFLPGLPPLPRLPPLPPLPVFPRYPPENVLEKEPSNVLEKEPATVVQP